MFFFYFGSSAFCNFSTHPCEENRDFFFKAPLQSLFAAVEALYTMIVVVRRNPLETRDERGFCLVDAQLEVLGVQRMKGLVDVST